MVRIQKGTRGRRGLTSVPARVKPAATQWARQASVVITPPSPVNMPVPWRERGLTVSKKHPRDSQSLLGDGNDVSTAGAPELVVVMRVLGLLVLLMDVVILDVVEVDIEAEVDVAAVVVVGATATECWKTLSAPGPPHMLVLSPLPIGSH
jgi:hypothetical protein